MDYILKKTLFGQLCIGSLIIVLSACSTNKKTQIIKNDELAIKAVFDRQTKAWNEGNLDAYMAGYWKDANLAFIGSKGVTRSWSQTLKNYKKAYPSKTAMGKLSFDILEMKRLSSSYYYMIGKYTLEREKDQPKGHFTLLWQKIAGQWVIISDHTSG